MEEIEAFAALAGIHGLGAMKIKRLVEHFGSAKAVLEGSIDEIAAVASSEKLIATWPTLGKQDGKQAWKNDMELARRSNVELIPYTDPRYPEMLLQAADHPALLYVKGDLIAAGRKSIAVVGTRNASIYGLEMAGKISRDLNAMGFTVISGLARGIDTAAHRGALVGNGKTVAVIGSGLRCIYPRENERLADEIARHGCLMSEFPMMTPPNKQNFPQRNRIVSGLSLGTLLVEAPLKSGAMITMERAFVQNRKLFALPGRADIDGFRGNHNLIKSGKAVLVEKAEDIVSHFEDLSLAALPQRSENQHFFLDEQERRLLDSMPTEEISVDNLALLMNFPIYQVNTILMGLVLKKAIREFPGKIYKKMTAGNRSKRHT